MSLELAARKAKAEQDPFSTVEVHLGIEEGARDLLDAERLVKCDRCSVACVCEVPRGVCAIRDPLDTCLVNAAPTPDVGDRDEQPCPSGSSQRARCQSARQALARIAARARNRSPHPHTRRQRVGAERSRRPRAVMCARSTHRSPEQQSARGRRTDRRHLLDRPVRESVAAHLKLRSSRGVAQPARKQPSSDVSAGCPSVRECLLTVRPPDAEGPDLAPAASAAPRPRLRHSTTPETCCFRCYVK